MSVNDYIILAAMEKEAAQIKTKAPILVTGIGACNVTKTLFENKARLDGKVIINVGYAGSTKYNVGKVLSVNKVRRFEPSRTIEEPMFTLQPYLFDCDICLTADNFVEEACDAPIIDMELYYIRNILENVISFKIISDNLNYKEYSNTYDKLQNSWREMNYIINEVING